MDGAGAGAATGATNTGGAGIAGAATTGAGATTTGAAFTTGAGAGATDAAGAILPDSNLAVRAWTAAVRASILDSRDMIKAFFTGYRRLNYEAVFIERFDEFT